MNGNPFNFEAMLHGIANAQARDYGVSVPFPEADTDPELRQRCASLYEFGQAAAREIDPVDRRLYIVQVAPPCECGWRDGPPGHACDAAATTRVDGRNFCNIHGPLSGNFEKRKIEVRP